MGVVDGYEGGRRIQAIDPPTIIANNPRPTAPAANPGGVRIASIDLGLYANGDGQGGGFTNPDAARSSAEYLRQRAKVVSMIHALSADVIAINGFESDGYGPLSAAQDLLDAVNTANPGPPYLLISPPAVDQDKYALQSAIFYRASKVLLVGVESLDLTDGGTAQPQIVWLQEESTGEQFAMLLLHLQTRDDCPANGSDVDAHDGQNCHNQSRTETAGAIGHWLTQNNYASDTLILGNWNAFAQEDPLRAVTALGFDDLTPEIPNGYTTVRSKHLGANHRLLAGSDVASLVGNVTAWHINSDESSAFDYRMDNPANLYAPDPYRAASADPLVIDLNIGELQAKFSVDAPIFIGETMQFTSQASGTGSLTYSWNFGDGSPLNAERDPSHTYKRIGTYEVTLTATDSRGSQSVGQYVDVLPRRIYLPVGAGGK